MGDLHLGSVFFGFVLVEEEVLSEHYRQVSTAIDFTWLLCFGWRIADEEDSTSISINFSYKKFQSKNVNKSHVPSTIMRLRLRVLVIKSLSRV